MLQTQVTMLAWQRQELDGLLAGIAST